MQKFVVTGSGKYPPKLRPKLRNGIRKDGGSHVLNITVPADAQRRLSQVSSKTEAPNNIATEVQPTSSNFNNGHHSHARSLSNDRGGRSGTLNQQNGGHQTEKAVKAMFFDSEEYKATKRSLAYDENTVASELRRSAKRPNGRAASSTEAAAVESHPAADINETLDDECECNAPTDYYETPASISNNQNGAIDCDCGPSGRKTAKVREVIDGRRHKRRSKNQTARKLSIDSIQQFCSVKRRPLPVSTEKRHRHSFLHTIDARGAKSRSRHTKIPSSGTLNGIVDPFFDEVNDYKTSLNGKIPRQNYEIPVKHPLVLPPHDRRNAGTAVVEPIVFDYDDQLSRDFAWHRYLCVGVFFAFIMWAAIFFPTIYILRQGPSEE